MTTRNPRPGQSPGDGNGDTGGSAAGAAQQPIPPQDEVSDGPRTPLELGGTGWKNTIKRTAKKFTRDRCIMTAGGSLGHAFAMTLIMDHATREKGEPRHQPAVGAAVAWCWAPYAAR
jgi:hypothetical protein